MRGTNARSQIAGPPAYTAGLGRFVDRQLATRRRTFGLSISRITDRRACLSRPQQMNTIGVSPRVSLRVRSAGHRARPTRVSQIIRPVNSRIAQNRPRSTNS